MAIGHGLSRMGKDQRAPSGKSTILILLAGFDRPDAFHEFADIEAVPRSIAPMVAVGTTGDISELKKLSAEAAVLLRGL